MKPRNDTILAVAACCLLAAASCSRHEPKVQDGVERTLDPIRIGMIPVLSGLPTFVALDERLFEEENFKVSLQEYRTSDLVVAAARAGEIDLIGVAGMSQILEAAAVDPELLRLIGVLFSSTCVIVPIDSPLATVSDLDSGEIATFPGSVFARYTKEVLAAKGVSSRSLVITPLAPGLQIKALEHHEVVAVYTLEPTCAEAVARRAARYLTQGDLFSEVFLHGRPFPGGGIAVSKQFLSSGSGRARRLLAVYGKSMSMIGDQSFDIRPYLLRHTQLSTEFAGNLVFEGAQFGETIDMDLLGILQGNLAKWGFLNGPLDAGLVALDK